MHKEVKPSLSGILNLVTNNLIYYIASLSPFNKKGKKKSKRKIKGKKKTETDLLNP